MSIVRLTGLWPKYSDHVALCALLRCRPSEGALRGRPTSAAVHTATGQDSRRDSAAASSDWATVAKSSSTGRPQAARGGCGRGRAKAAASSGRATGTESSSTRMTLAPSPRGQGRPAACAPARELTVVVIGSAIVQCAMAVDRAGVSDPGEAMGGHEGVKMPN